MFELKVDGMSCQHCVKAVTKAVHDVAPQASVAIDLGTGIVTLGNIDEAHDLAAIKASIDDAGYSLPA